MNFFAYGTLMWPQVISAVIGRDVKGVPARLDCVARLRVRGEIYPSLIPDDRSSVEGVLYCDISVDEVNALDQFEGAEYERKRVIVHAGDGVFESEVYFCSESGVATLAAERWNPDEVSPEDLDRFSLCYKGWKERV